MKSIKFVTGLVRLSYANIWTPKEDLSKRMRYSASLLIKKSDTKTVSRLKSKIKDLINDEEAKKILGTKGKDLDLPLRDGDKEKEGDPNYAGHYFLNAKASEEYPPKILDNDGEMLMDKSEIYSGCYCQAVLSLFVYNQGGNRGVGVGLNGLKKIKDGEPLSGGGVSARDFDNSLISDENDDDDIF